MTTETFVPGENIHGPILPQFILTEPITAGAKIMYALLCNHASRKNRCWPSHSTLAKGLSCSVSSVKRYLAELIGVKLFSARREQYRSCVYLYVGARRCNGYGHESRPCAGSRAATVQRGPSSAQCGP